MFRKDTPGDARASTIAAQNLLMRLGEQLVRVDQLTARDDAESYYIHNLTVRWPTDSNADYLVVLRRNGPEGKQVAFHSADTFAEVVRGTLAKWQNKSLQWKEDSYA